MISRGSYTLPSAVLMHVASYYFVVAVWLSCCWPGVWDRVNANLPLDFDASRWRPTDTEDLKLARGAWAGLGDWKPQPLSRKEKMAQKKKKRD